jgi:hypothetical protein
LRKFSLASFENKSAKFALKRILQTENARFDTKRFCRVARAFDFSRFRRAASANDLSTIKSYGGVYKNGVNGL